MSKDSSLHKILCPKTIDSSFSKCLTNAQLFTQSQQSETNAVSLDDSLQQNDEIEEEDDQ